MGVGHTLMGILVFWGLYHGLCLIIVPYSLGSLGELGIHVIDSRYVGF